MREKLSKNVKNQFGKIKFGENVKILIIVVELQKVWQIDKICQIRQTFLSPNICPVW